MSSSTALFFDGYSWSAEWSVWQMPIAATLAMFTDGGVYKIQTGKRQNIYLPFFYIMGVIHKRIFYGSSGRCQCGNGIKRMEMEVIMKIKP